MPALRSSKRWACRRWSSPPTSSGSRSPRNSVGPSASLAEAGELAGRHQVRLALEFQKSARFCACLDTTLALIGQSGADNVGACLDLFHYYTGPSKFEDLAFLSRETSPGSRSATSAASRARSPAMPTVSCRVKAISRSSRSWTT